MVFKGSAVALVTPFDENGKVNFDKIKESFKAITQDRTSICKEYPEELSFNDDLIKSDLKQKKGLVLNEILNIKAKIKMSQSKLINNTKALIMNN